MKEKASNQVIMENVERAFHHLESLEKVDAPPFLLTRIQQRIANKELRVKPVWAYSLAAALLLLFVFNVRAINQQAEQTQEQQFIQSMGIQTSYSLYP